MVRISREIQCLPYAGFFALVFSFISVLASMEFGHTLRNNKYTINLTDSLVISDKWLKQLFKLFWLKVYALWNLYN